MKVVAIATAFVNGRRVRPGAELDIPENSKGSWFARVDTTEAKAAKQPKASKQEQKALSELGNANAKSFTDVIGEGDANLA